MKTIIKNAKIVTPAKVCKGSLLIENGIIKAVNVSKVKSDRIIDAKNSFVLPGFFDTHIHGGAGFDSSSGRFDVSSNTFVDDEIEYEKGIKGILQEHFKHGTTSMILGTGTVGERQMGNFMKYGGYFVKNQPGGATLRGLDIEGVFIKDAAFAGAQSLNFLKEPDTKYFDSLMKISDGNIKRILVAPEWGEPAIKFIKHITKANVVAGVGHSGATYDQFMKAYDAGVKVLIHFGNGPMSQNFKGGGILDAAFYLKDKLYAEIICDYHHVNPKWIVPFLRNFNFKVIGITDAMFIVGCAGNIKEFEHGGKTCVVEKDVLKLKGSINSLFGSMLTTDKAFENFLNIFMKNIEGYLVGRLFEKAIDLNSAVVKVSKLMSFNPAKLYGLSGEIGTIEKGKKAELVIMDIKKIGPDHKCRVLNVMNGDKFVAF